MLMRDIRADLKERTAAHSERIADLEAKLAAEKKALASTEELLTRENEYWANQDDLFRTEKKLNGRKPALLEFLKDTLSRGHPMTLQELSERALAQGYDFEGKSPGRAIHFRLVSLSKAHQAQKDGDYWRLIDSS
jgi:hypothetical protein